jgi:outer membrane protein TolC
MLETAGKRSRRLEVARQQLALAEAEYGERTRQLRFELSSRYADLFSESERLRALERLIEINRRSLELTRARVEKGDAAALDASLIAVEISGWRRCGLPPWAGRAPHE